MLHYKTLTNDNSKVLTNREKHKCSSFKIKKINTKCFIFLFHSHRNRKVRQNYKQRTKSETNGLLQKQSPRSFYSNNLYPLPSTLTQHHLCSWMCVTLTPQTQWSKWGLLIDADCLTKWCLCQTQQKGPFDQQESMNQVEPLSVFPLLRITHLNCLFHLFPILNDYKVHFCDTESIFI